jgi:D-xylose transport system substrate-binding protein
VDRWQRDRDLLVEEIRRRGAKSEFRSAEGDPDVQNRQVEELLNANIDVLIIVPNSATEAAAAVKNAKNHNVPVISYDRLVLNCELDIYISFDSVRVGKMQSEYLASKTKGHFYLMGGDPDDNNARLCRQGQFEALLADIRADEIEIIGQDWADDWSPERARELTLEMLGQQKLRVDAIVASNDGTAGGVIKALEEVGLAGEVLVSGQDAELAACHRILAGTQTMTVYKPIGKLAKKAAQVAVALAKGEEVTHNRLMDNKQMQVPSILLEPVALDKENLVEVLTRDEFYSLDALIEKTPAGAGKK